MNPILRREFLARWRDKRSHLLLLALTLLLAIASYMSYENALNTVAFNPMSGLVVTESVITRASRAGHALFSTLAIGNVAIWFVLAPLLLATGVARERERGLLESLQLSPMRPASQIIARALSALSYLAMLQMVTLPIYFVAFTFGGVSEQEIFRVWIIVAASAFCGVGLGLALSAQSPRPSGALFGAVALLVAWSLLAIFMANYGFWFSFIGLGWALGYLNEALLYGHPVVLACNLCYRGAIGLPMIATVGSEEMMPRILLGWGVLGLLGLIKAMRDVTRPLPPSTWAGRNTLIQKWKNRREARLKAQLEKQRAKVSVEGALLADLPFDRLIRFKNPLLNREVKSRFRLRRASAWVWTARILFFLAGASVWAMVLFTVLLDPPGRPGAVPVVLWGEWILGTALIATFAASSFAREREAGTWEGVQLSLLKPGEVARTKWASPLVAFALLSSPLWLLLFALVILGGGESVSLLWVGLGALVVIASLCWSSALGSWISLRSKNTASATCWTIGALLVMFLGLPFSADYFKIPNRIALWRYGLTGELATRDYYTPQNMALYEQQTGIKVRQPYSSTTQRPTQAEMEAWSNYYNWFNKIDVDMWRFQKSLNFWSPIDVLMGLQDRNKTSYKYNNRALGDETLVPMALLYVFLAGTGTFVLLQGVRVRLQKPLE
ncbi:ABC transporter permease [bacterium]|nr:MAG: ABC transporter permease [bacterium]